MEVYRSYHLGLVDGGEPVQALGRIRDACREGIWDACDFFAEYGDPEDAAAVFESVCDDGEARACIRRALDWAPPFGEREGEHAIAYLDRGCELGSGRACNLAGLTLEYLGDPFWSVVRGYYEQRCARENSEACGNLAFVLWAGLGGAQDVAEAARIDPSL